MASHDKETVYSKLSSSEDGRLSSSDTLPILATSSKKNRHFGFIRISLFSVLNCIFFLTSCSLLALAAWWPASVDDNACARRLSVWSPALDAVKYEESDFQNAFDEPSVYRGPPTEEREQAWLDLWDHAAISIPEEKLSLLNKSASTTPFRRLPTSVGGGFSALPDVFHQLHCLDMIRQYSWLQSGNYGDSPTTVAGEPKRLPLVPVPPAFRGSSDIANRMHIDHCLETIRKTLMCHADVTPLLIVADPSNPIGDRPDFNIHQKCRNWDAIREWTTKNRVIGRE